ncbi:MAG: thymidine phosphorylase family protein [Bacteroidia bacterium]|nr:thymidine phosphorylase family protein [Bacteroidia bacterium]
MNSHHIHQLRAKNIGIDTYRENIVYMRADCHICQSEGFTALTRIVVHHNDRSIIATLNVVHSELLDHEEAGLSMEAMKRLAVKEGDCLTFSHLKHLSSLSYVRAKMYHKELTEQAFNEIIADIVAGRYSNIELAAFISGCSGNNLSLNEIIGLTKAMINSGQKIKWNNPMIFDKHCVGGLPGNRTTPIVVSIVAAAGLTIPKTSSRAITSPAGTADTMETMTRVNLGLDEIKQVVGKENGCIVWGGAVKLSPADDILISVEKSLDVDSEGQMIASVLSKKAAAGATHVVIDIPVGETAKVRSTDEAKQLQSHFEVVGKEIGLQVKVILTDGSQPVGRGIGPSLEAMDVLSVLRNEKVAPLDLKERAIVLAGMLLELSGKYAVGTGNQTAKEILETGKALAKFLAICEKQGGFREPQYAIHKQEILSEREGIVKSIDNRKLALVAKLAGAPKSPSAGILFLSPLGKKISKGDELFIVYAEAKGELEYAIDYMKSNNNIISIE